MTTKRHAPRIYLAGPEVFLPDALALAEEKKRLCAELGLVGVFPLDVEIENDAGIAPADKAREISRNNERLMRSCELLIANCTPFRGPSMDVGTAYEIGFMRARGRPVLGYTNVVEDYATRVRASAPAVIASWDAETQNSTIEDFGLPENLMIAVPIAETASRLVARTVPPDRMLSDLGGFRDCLEIARRLQLSNAGNQT